MTNYYTSLFVGRDTTSRKKMFDTLGESPNKSNALARWCFASMFMLISLLVGQQSVAQIALPYNEAFTGITVANGFPTVAGGAWTRSGTTTLQPTFITNQATFNRSGNGDTKFMVFRWGQPAAGNSYFVGPFALVAGQSYLAGIKYKSDGVSGFGPLSLTYGTLATAATHTNTIVSLPASITNLAYANLSGAFTPATSGNYFIAVKCIGTSVPDALTIDDFSIVVNSPCAGTPAPGNTVANTSSVCAGIPTAVALSLQTPTIGSGVTYQWFNSAGSISGATSATYTTPALIASNIYFCNVTCSAVTTASNPVAITVGSALTTFPVTESFESITTAGTLANCFVSTPAVSLTSKVRTFVGAALVTNPALSARTGNNYAAVNWAPSNSRGTIYSPAVQLTAGNTYSAEVFYKTDGVAWSEVSMRYGTSPTEAAMTNIVATITGAASLTYSSLNGTFTPTVSGIYYIAFQAFNSDFSPNFCVFDDFSLNELLPCAGTPNLGTVAIASASGCAGLNVGLSATALTTGLGITYQWQTSTDNVAFTNISGATANSYALPTVFGLNYFRLNTTCANSTTTSSSNSVSYTGTLCTYDTAYSTGASYVSIMPANGGTGVAFPGWVIPSTGFSSGDDNTSTTVALTGTTFTYQGSPVTGFQACSNGWMTFDTTNTSVSFTNNLSATTPKKMLAPLWDDLVFTGQAYANRDASLRYLVSGTLGSGSAIITVEWAGIERFNLAGPNLNFQVKLYESDNHIEFIYGTIDAFDGTLGTAANYSYSVGYNGSNPAGTSSVDRFALQAVGQNFFGTDAIVNGNLNSLPACNSKYTLTPGLYSGLTVAPIAVAPSNDNATGAFNLAVGASPISTYCGTYYSSKGATNSGSGLACGAITGNEDDDVWFKFSTTAATDYTLKLRASTNYNGVLQLLDAAFAPISCVNASGIGLTETLNVTGLIAGGTTYYVRVFHDGVTIGTSSGDFSVSINEVILPPTNDNITGATALTVGATCTTLNSQLPSTLAATGSTTLPAACFTADDDVWYSFVATSATNTITVQSGTGYNASFQVLSSSDNTAAGTLTQVACVNLTTTGGVETSNTLLVPGNTYFVRVYHAAAGVASGNFSICVTAPIPTCVAGKIPADLAVDVATNQILSWTAAVSAASYDVFFGPTATGAVFIANQAGTTYAPVMAASTSYTYKVVAKNGNGSATGCTETSFTTAIPPGCTSLDTPANGATGIPVGVIPFSWTAPAVTPTASAATSYDLFFRPNLTATKTLVGNFTETNASIILTGFNSTFYITIVPKNALGAATGCIETSFTTEADPFVPYCSSVTYTTVVEPITSVNFAGINNVSSAETGGSSIENFISVVGTVATGIPYTMTLKGNTDGAFTSNFRVFVDWNHDNDFADAGETYNAGTILSSTGVDAISAVSTILVPSTALLGNTRMRVKKLFGTTTIDNACVGGVYGQSEDYTLNVVQSNTTKLTVAACGSTLPLIYSTIYAIPKSGVTGYRFEVSNVATPLATPQTIDKPLQFFSLTQLASYEYATTYSVRVMLKVGTQWLGYYGDACRVTTPGVLVSPTVGPAIVTSPACGTTLASKSAAIYTTPQSGVTGYRFRVVKSGSLPATVQIIDRTLQFFSFNDVTAFVYNTVYTVEVSYKTTGDYLPYGTSCTFTTPMPLVATTTCGATIALTGGIYAKPLASAVSYRFEVTNLGDEFPTGVVYTRPTQLLSASLIPLYSSSNSYSVRVAVETASGVSPFGDACTINPAAAARQAILSKVFTAVAYPNPFETNFSLNVTTASDDKVTVAVYDMIGKMLESKEVNASELQAIELGTNFQSGVYNVVVSQGENVKSIRMVKR